MLKTGAYKICLSGVSVTPITQLLLLLLLLCSAPGKKESFDCRKCLKDKKIYIYYEMVVRIFNQFST